jgi:hypothetical protein
LALVGPLSSRSTTTLAGGGAVRSCSMAPDLFTCR